jgi:energy-coupling factor transport system ATP-binding protein
MRGTGNGMIELDHASFSYRSGETDAVPALRDITLTIQPGEFVAVIGHNGSGKSTLSKLLTAVLYPTSGEVRVDGIPVTPANRWEIRRRVAIVFQDPDDQLVANRVRDDVAFGPENIGLPRDEIAQRVEVACAALGLHESEERLIEDLSPGEKQRVAIAGALAMRPLFLILDEPTSLLPVPVANRLIDRMRELNQTDAMGVLHITHFMNEAARFDRVLVLDAGHVVLDGTPQEVFRHVDQLRQIGLDVPTAVSLAHRLRERGYPIDDDVLDEQALTRSLTALLDGGATRRRRAAEELAR